MQFSHPLRLSAVIAILVASACSTPTPEQACDREGEYRRRCSPMQLACEAEEARHACLITNSQYRGEYLARLSECYSSDLGCDDAAGESLTRCVRRAPRGLSLTDAHRALINGYCSVCPSVIDEAAETPPSTDDCVAALTAAPSADGAVSAATVYTFRKLADSYANEVRECLERIGMVSRDEACEMADACLRDANNREATPPSGGCPEIPDEDGGIIDDDGGVTTDADASDGGDASVDAGDASSDSTLGLDAIFGGG